jgi:nitrile hydratase beta subunit
MSYVSNADLGGRGDSRAVVPEPEGELFHAPWEPRVLALNVAMGATGLWNIDRSRAARETLANYADLTYYEIWLAGLEKLLLDSGIVQPRELREGHALQEAVPIPRKLEAGSVAAVLARGSPVSRQTTQPQRFRVGEAVRTRADQPDHHTRLPAYVRGKHGIIERVHGVHVFADAQAQGLGEQPQWLYTVVFTAPELWGEPVKPDAPRLVSVDAWEPYLEPA